MVNSFRHCCNWRGRLILQISYRQWHPYLGMLTYWRDARVEDLEAWARNTRQEKGK